MKNYQRSLAAALVVALALGVTACSNAKKKGPAFDNSEKSEAQLKAEAAALYRLARKDLDSSQWQSAIGYYDDLSKRYPFTEIATQGEIERIYALYRNSNNDTALSAADKFMREHPRNGNIDYVLYLKGLTEFYRDPSFSSMLGVQSYLGDVSSDRRAFDNFTMLIQRFPDSRYRSDARERMVYLRNKIALHEVGVVRFYVKRGAFIAAAKRAEQVIAQYPGAPATFEAVELMETAYRRAGLNEQADDAARLLAGQPNPGAAVLDLSGSEKAPWWKRMFGGSDNSEVPDSTVVPTAEETAPAAAPAKTEEAAPQP